MRSTFTLTPKTVTIGDDGGYKQSTVVDGTAETINAIPSSYVKTRLGLEKFGDLKSGEIRFLIRDDVTFDTDDEVTFQGKSYHIRAEEPIFFNEVTIAIPIVLSRKLD